jgi:DNA-binding LytR/AlgR family response regulator
MEIKIAICDDEHKQTEYIKMLVSKWANVNNINIMLEMFDSAENFKSAWNENKIFDILLLDIQMRGQNGVELARELRGTDEDLIIIFITAITDFISDGYEVSALHYLIKPIDTDKLYAVLNKALKNLTKNNSAIFLPIESESGIMRVLTDDIIYAESFDHFLEITTIAGEKLTVKMPMYELENKLENNFKRCHRSYIVNLKYIKKIIKTEIMLDSNEVIPLSRRLYAEMNKAVIKYFTERKK